MHAQLARFMFPAALLTGVLIPSVQSTTTWSDTHYATDFMEDVSTHFCDAAIIEWRYSSDTNASDSAYTIHNGHSFASGSLTLYGRYGNGANLALITGGAQSQTLVPVGNNGTNYYDYAHGIFTNSVISMTYSLYNPEEPDHTDITVRLAARKNDTPPHQDTIGPYPYRVPHYVASYDGVRLSVGEWTYSNGAPVREIAGVDAGVSTNTSTFTLVFSVSGGDDDGGSGNGTPCLLAAKLYENNILVTETSGQDNPYDWTLGPELPDTVFKPTGDYNNGEWRPYAGDWDDHQSWSRGNHDIRLPGWIVISSRQASAGSYQGIVISDFAVNPPPPGLHLDHSSLTSPHPGTRV